MSANLDYQEFRRLVADYFVIPSYQGRFNFYDWLGQRLDETLLRQRSVPVIMDQIREAGDKDGVREAELDSILNPDGKRYNMLYFGTKTFRKKFDEYCRLKLDKQRNLV